MRDIKRLKPGGGGYGKNLRTGDFREFKPQKYCGNPNQPIWYRSSYELAFMRQLEFNPLVESWNSENIKIPYLLPGKSGNKIVNTRHNYFMDFQVFMKNGNKYLCEVKPLAFVPLNESQLKKSPEHFKNANKWRAAIAWCKRNNHTFKLITESQLKQPLT